MHLFIERDYEAMSVLAARVVADLVKKKPNAVLGLATGSTPLGTYQELVKLAEQEAIDFSGVTTFNLDEYEGLPAAHPQSYQAFMDKHLFHPLGLRHEQSHLLSGVAKDPWRECAEFEQKIRDAGGIDLQLLGIGGDGHIAFNEPGSSLAGRTSLVSLHPRTISDNARFFDRPDEVPRRALTMGIGTILEARACLILASGDRKAPVWAGMAEGPVTSQLPASVLQMHPWTLAICDEPAAGELKHLEHYRRLAKEHRKQPLLPMEMLRFPAREAVVLD